VRLLCPLRLPSFLWLLWLLLIGLVPSVAHAQTGPIELRQFQPTPFSDGTLRLDGPNVLPAWRLHAGAYVDYAWKPLVLMDVAPSIQRSRKTTYDFVGHAVGLDLTFAMGIGHHLEVAAIVPVTAFQIGDSIPGGTTPGVVGLENPKLGAKMHLLGNGTRGFGLGASVLVALPFGLGGTFIHEESLGVEARLFGELARERWKLRARAGFRLRGETQIFDIPLGDELTFAAGAETQLASQDLVFAEVAGATAAGHPLGSQKQTPVELLVGGRREVGARWLGGDNRFWLTVAAGPGLTAGYGSPAVRAVVALTWANVPRPHPPAPPAPPAPVVEKCPGGPGCPKEAPKPPSDRDKDGILDEADECPDEPEDKDGFEDEDGCPDPDNDKDGIPDVADKCPNEPETINGVDDDDGCPDKGAVAVRVGKEELEILKPIFFETDHSRVRHAFFNVLGQIALTLKAHPEIGRCAVEGHTDDTGPPEWNQKLSVLRADAVVEFLVGKGVERSRLTAIGHGEKVPWAPNDTEEGRAKNRRVIFHIEGVNGDEAKKQERRQRVRARKAEQESSAPDAPTPPKGGNGSGNEKGGQKNGQKNGDEARPGGTREKPQSEARPDTGREPVTRSVTTTKATVMPKEPTATDPPLKFKSVDSPEETPKRPAPAPAKSNKPATLRDLLRLPDQQQQ
jgi:outer membrane protein OmpA-like peptidoglycan-associated protein